MGSGRSLVFRMEGTEDVESLIVERARTSLGKRDFSWSLWGQDSGKGEWVSSPVLF